jgi:S1-C subfamily serine protease
MMRALPLTILASLATVSSGHAEDKKESEIRNSVVKIFATQRMPDYLKPWDKQNAREISGSGVVIDGQRILTNAHVVEYAKQIYVQPHQSSDKFSASVVTLAPGMDLAILKLDDETFFKTRPPLSVAADLPEIKDSVSVYGYPMGGSSLSVTKGIVSRIGLAAYPGEWGLQFQVDAALNPGNSGGPALVDGRMIGVVYSYFPNAQSIGYIIPAEEINEFLTISAKGKYQGKLSMWVQGQKLENHALRAKLGLEEGVTGDLIRSVPSKDAAYPLKQGDIITKIGNYAIDNAGMVRVKDGLHVHYAYLVPKLAKQDKIHLSILRQGKALEIDVPLYRDDKYVLKSLNGNYPSYFIYGPITFSTASSGSISALYAPLAPDSPLFWRGRDLVSFEGEELVLIVSAFPHKTIGGYANPVGRTVNQINGIKVKNLRHLVEMLRDTKDKFIELDFVEKNAEKIVLDRIEVEAAQEDLLADNGIRQPCSADVLPYWRKGDK